MPDLIYLDTPNLSVTSAFKYRLAANVSFDLLLASCNFDGSTSGDPWLPILAILAQDGTIVAYFGQDVFAKAGDFVFCTFAPNSQPPSPAPATTNYATQTNMPVIPLENGWQIWVDARKTDQIGPGSASVLLQGLSLMVEQTSGPRSGLAPGPFMLIPGPGS